MVFVIVIIFLFGLIFNSLNVCLIALNILSISTFYSLKRKMIEQLFFSCYLIFHLIPLNYIYIVDSEIHFIMFNAPSDLYMEEKILIILFLFNLGFLSLKKIRVPNLFYSFLNKNRTNDKSNKLFILNILFFVIAFLGLMINIKNVNNYGYAEFHLGEDYQKRSPLFAIAEIIFLILNSILMSKKKKFSSMLLLVYGFLIFLTGMRLPFLLIILIVYMINFKINRNFFFKPMQALITAIVCVVFLSYSQFSRFDVDIEDLNFKDNFEYLGFAADQQLRILSTTNDLILGSVVVKSSSIDTEFTYNPIYTATQILGLVFRKMTGSKVATMDERADSGHLGYQIFRKFRGDLFKDGKTAGGASLSDVYYFFGFFGVFLFGIFTRYIASFYEKVRKMNHPVTFYLIVSCMPLFLRSFRDGYLVFLVMSIVYMTFFLFVFKTLKLFKIC